MPTLPISILSLLAADKSVQGGNQPQESGDGFQSLLDVGGRAEGGVPDRSEDIGAARDDESDERMPDPTAVAVEVPTAIFAERDHGRYRNEEPVKQPEKISSANDAPAQDDVPQNAGNNINAAQAAEAKPQGQPEKETQAAVEAPSDAAVPAANDNAAAVQETSATAAVVVAAETPSDPLAAQLQDHIKQLSDALHALSVILQGLGGIVRQAVVQVSVHHSTTVSAAIATTASVTIPAATGEGQTPQAVTLPSVLPPGTLLEGQDADLVLPAFSSLQEKIAVPEGLVQRLQNMLQKLQSAGTAVAGAQAEITPDVALPAGELQSELSELRSDIGRLLLSLKPIAAKQTGVFQQLEAAGKTIDGTQTQLGKNIEALTAVLPKLKSQQAQAAVSAVIEGTNGTPKDNNNPVVKPELAAASALLPPVAAKTDVAPAQPNQPAVVQPVAASGVQPVAAETSPDTSSGGEQRNPDQNAAQSIFGIRSAGQAVAGSEADRATFGRILQHVASAPVQEQVTFHVKTALADGSSKIQIQLDPVELGKLEIKLDVAADGKTGVTITADNKSTLDALQRDMAGLQRALADAGLKTDSGSLSFNLRGGQQENHPSSHAAQSYRDAAPEEEEIVPLATLSRSYVVNLADGLDIRI